MLPASPRAARVAGPTSIPAPGSLRRETQVSLHRQVREQTSVLEHETEVTGMRRYHDAAVGVLPELIAYRDPSLRAGLKTGNDSQQGRLARAARTENRRDAVEIHPRVDLQGKIVPDEPHIDCQRRHESDPVDRQAPIEYVNAQQHREGKQQQPRREQVRLPIA